MTLYKKKRCGVVHINEKGIKDDVVGDDVGGGGDGTIKKTVRYKK